MSEQACLNTDPPAVRCGMCGGRLRHESARCFACPRCPWSSLSPRHTMLRWRARRWLGWPTVADRGWKRRAQLHRADLRSRAEYPL